MTTPAIVACLGDSLTLGGTGAERHAWPARLDINTSLYPQAGFANFGKSGDQSSGYAARYTAGIKGKGFGALVILGCINDVTNDVLASVSWANIEPIIDDAIADELPVILISTSPFGSSGDWTAPRQLELLALRAFFAAKAGVTYLDFYELLGDPANPINLNPDVDYGDGKHYSADGTIAVEEILAPQFVALFPAPIPPPAPPASTITWADVTGGVDGIGSELASLSVDSQNEILTQVALQVKPSAWGSEDHARAGRLWLARHLGSLRKGGTGVLLGVTVGQVSKTFANPMSLGALQSTRYGNEYLRLMRIWLPRFATT